MKRYQYSCLRHAIGNYFESGPAPGSVTGGAEINFGGAREVYSSVDQMKKVKYKKKRSSVQKFPQLSVVVSKFLQFFTNSYVKAKKKSSFQKFYEIRCESTKITKKRFLLGGR